MHDSVATDRFAWSARFFSKLHRYVNLLRKFWWILVLTASGTVGGYAWYIKNTPAKYSTSAKLIANNQMSIPGVVSAEQSGIYDEIRTFNGTQIALLHSSEVLERAKASVKIKHPNLVGTKVDVKASQRPESAILIVQATGFGSEYILAYLEAVLEEYLKYRNELQEQSSDSTFTAINAELRTLEEELRKGEQKMLDFQKENNVVFLEEQGNSSGRYLVNLNAQLADLKKESQLLNLLSLEQNLERRKAQAGEEVVGTTAREVPGTDYRKAQQEIQLLKAERDDLSKYLRPKHPKMIKLEEDIVRQEKLLSIFKQQSTEQLANRRQTAEVEIKNLEKLIAEWESKSLDVSKRMGEHQRIKAMNQRAQNLYDRLLNTLQSFDVGKSLKQDRVAIFEKPSKPVSQRTGYTMSLVVAGLLGLGIGLGILLLLDQLDDRLSSFTELTNQFEETVLGQIPREKDAGPAAKLKLLGNDDERHAFAEAYRNLRSGLLFMATSANRPKILLVTSSVPHEGKSTVSADLAIILSQGGSKVLLVDGDMRRGTFHDSFGVSNALGVSEVLSQEAPWRDAVKPTKIPNLWLMPRGKSLRNPGELFLGPAADIMLRGMREDYDFVVFDSAPVLATDDTANLAPKVDGTLFVIRADFTAVRAARTGLDLLYQRQVKVLGLVFNSVDVDRREYYYYKYSNYYTKA